MQHVSLYGHAQLVQVWLDQGPVKLCVSRVPQRDKSRTRERLLLLHGNPASMHDFGQLAALLRDEFEVVAIDLPGFGRSGNVRAVAHESVLDTHARHIVAALARIGWNNDFYVLGHSHGGAVAQTIAALFPERVQGLVLLGAVGTPTPWCYRQLVLPGMMNGLQVLAKTLNHALPARLRWRIVQAVMTPIFAPHPLSHQWINEQLAVVESRPEILVNMALVATGDPCAQLGRNAACIKAPALFIHGAEDRLVPAQYARAIYATVSRSVPAEFHVLPDTGHMLHISHPPQIKRLVSDWFARLRASDLTSELAEAAQ